jgi:hypothetical protein
MIYGMDFELVRLFVVYGHLLACCVALGLILVSDIETVWQLFFGDGAGPSPEHVEKLQNSVFLALAALWATGIGIIALDYEQKGVEYFENPKLQAKLGVVAILTLNGFFLHLYTLPKIKRAGSLIFLRPIALKIAVMSGSISAVSWLYAALFGVGKTLSWKYSFYELLFLYPFFIVIGYWTIHTMLVRVRDRQNVFVPREYLRSLLSMARVTEKLNVTAVRHEATRVYGEGTLFVPENGFRVEHHERVIYVMPPVWQSSELQQREFEIALSQKNLGVKAVERIAKSGQIRVVFASRVPPPPRRDDSIFH